MQRIAEIDAEVELRLANEQLQQAQERVRVTTIGRNT
jgi:hypothetical protein